MDVPGAGPAGLTMGLLVVNAGSSSLKLRLIGAHDELLDSADVDADSDGVDLAALDDALDGWPAPDAIGHRIVHGGTIFTSAVVVDDVVRRQLEQLVDLAPLHQPKSLAALDAVTARFEHVPAIACFDTAFHATIPPAAATYAVPREWRQRFGIRRYGFHGLSHAYCARRSAGVVGRPVTELRIVTCHLGAGASLAAVQHGRSVDTTMGFTPLEGLVMATRSGSVDPGLVLWLEEHEHLAPHEIATALETRSGLLGLAGTADLREVEAAAGAGDPDATLALEVYLHRLVAGIGAMVSALGGVDVLAFTGGVGEHSALVRRRAVAQVSYLDIGVDQELNEATSGDRDISAAGSRIRCVIVVAREDLEIAGEMRRLVPIPGACRT